MLGLALLFFVGFSSCEKDGIAHETALASAAGQTTSNGDSDGAVTSRSLCDCDCEYKINSVTGYPSSGNHLEMLGITNTDFCSSCPLAFGFYGCGYYSDFGSDPCAYNMTGGILAFPTRWISFNCSVDGGQPFTKRFFLVQKNSSCDNPGNLVAGSISYSIRCKGVGTSEWVHNTDNIINFSGSGNPFLDVVVTLEEDEFNCDCSPTID